MKFSKVFLLLALMVLAVSVAKADTIDPTVIIRQVDPPPPVPITDPNGTIPVAFSAGSNLFTFQNDTGTLLYSLSLTLFGFPQGLDFNFDQQAFDQQGIFSSFSKTVNQDGSQTLLFFGIDEFHTGLLPSTGCNVDSDGDADDFCGPVYQIEIDGIPPPINGINEFAFGSVTVSTPEPATLLLLSTGLVGLAAFRRRRSSPQA